MKSFVETIAELRAAGYADINVEEKLAQDIVLKAIDGSGLKANMTVKGGVVMATMTQDIRRTTMDLDVDFIHYSIEDDSIDRMVECLNCVDGVTITRVGDIQELKHQDYSGKRVFLSLCDEQGYAIQYKLDIGVHTVAEAEQKDRLYDLTHIESKPVSLLSNGPEQVFVEKIKSLLRLGRISSRGKDVFDLAYLTNHVEKEKLKKLIGVYIYSDRRMFERGIEDIVRRLEFIFADRGFMAMLANRRMNWLQLSPPEAARRVIAFLKTL